MKVDEQAMAELHRLFDEQFPNLPVGGFYNPVVKCVNQNGVVEFVCNYDGYDQFADDDDYDDGWTWSFNPQTRTFF